MDGHQCTRAVVVGDLCAEHDELDRAAAEDPVLVAEWNQFVPQAQGELGQFAHEDPVLVAEWNQFVPQAQGELGQFAHDRQNVHTSVVTEITNRGLEHLLSFPTTKSETYVMRYIESTMLSVELLESNVDEYNWFIDKVLPDMQSWYKKTTCRAPGDKLYKRVVQGVFAKIQTYPKDTQKELWKRFEEEASDSVGMCCDGHITRMVNVFAGIDESCAPEVSVGEQLQTRIAAIAAGDDTTEDKIRRATEVMNELHVPEIERTAWIEAL